MVCPVAGLSCASDVTDTSLRPCSDESPRSEGLSRNQDRRQAPGHQGRPASAWCAFPTRAAAWAGAADAARQIPATAVMTRLVRRAIVRRRPRFRLCTHPRHEATCAFYAVVSLQLVTQTQFDADLRHEAYPVELRLSLLTFAFFNWRSHAIGRIIHTQQTRTGQWWQK